MGTDALDSRLVLETRVDATSQEDAACRIVGWAEKGESRYVCVANVHMVMEAHDSKEFRRVVNGADLVTPDGMPLVWALRLQGLPEQTRVYGPDLTLHVCAAAAAAGVPVGFYGSTPAVLESLAGNLARRFPSLALAYKQAPPFRALTGAEEEAVVSRINESGARVLFVGLGCPKQERWMAKQRGKVRAAMVGVGAAFDFHAGALRQAPRFLQNLGLEWLFRLGVEPRRLFARYARHNPRFVLLFARQLLGFRSSPR